MSYRGVTRVGLLFCLLGLTVVGCTGLNDAGLTEEASSTQAGDLAFVRASQAPGEDAELIRCIADRAGLEPSSADPLGFGQMESLMSADMPPRGMTRIHEHLSVEFLGGGQLVPIPDDPDPRPGQGRRTSEVEEPGEPADARYDSMRLNVFNTMTRNQFELVLGQPLLGAIHACRMEAGLTSANEQGELSEEVPPTRRGAEDETSAQGWSNAVDTRSVRSPTTLWPWRTISQFRGGSQDSSCTGTLIGPRHVITAAHCINKIGTNTWYSFTITPGKNGTGGSSEPFGNTSINPNPQPGDPFRWYFTPSPWRNCDPDEAFQCVQWDWGLIIIPERLGDLTGWMGYVARPGSQLTPQTHFNRGYPNCGTTKPNKPAGCQTARLYGDQSCALGSYLYTGPDGWNRVIKTSCDLSAGHSGSPIYHYFFDPVLGKTVPVVAMMVSWEDCYTCSPTNTFPNRTRRITPGDLDTISFFRQWKP